MLMRVFLKNSDIYDSFKKKGVSIRYLSLSCLFFEDSSMILCKVHLKNQPLLIGVTYNSKQYIVCN